MKLRMFWEISQRLIVCPILVLLFLISDFSPVSSASVPANNELWDWGANRFGQLGTGTIESSDVPVRVNGLTGIISIAAGDDHTLALKSDGTVWAWGANNFGELGNGTNIASNIPVQVSGLTDVVAIAASGG
jgi:alpha-tubulin suppressor-like RCC1 family protein